MAVNLIHSTRQRRHVLFNLLKDGLSFHVTTVYVLYVRYAEVFSVYLQANKRYKHFREEKAAVLLPKLYIA